MLYACHCKFAFVAIALDTKLSSISKPELSVLKSLGSTVEPVLGDPWFGRPLVLGDHNPRHGSFLTIKYLP